MNRKIIFGLGLLAIVLISGCTSTPRTNRQNFYFNDTNNSIENDRMCFDLCKGREFECYEDNVQLYFSYEEAKRIHDIQYENLNPFNVMQRMLGWERPTENEIICSYSGYYCDYDPLVCEDGVCLCKTW